MMKRLACVGVMAMALGCSHIQKHHDEENEGHEVRMSINDIPASARATILSEADGTPVTAVDREEKEGRVIYEADAKIKGQNWEINVTPDGKLISKKIDNDED